jgi:hypothetical protein
MRKYIFTEKERKIIETYVDQGIHLEGFNQLDHRMRTSWSSLMGDLILAFRWGAAEYTVFEEVVGHVQRLKDYLDKLI